MDVRQDISVSIRMGKYCNLQSRRNAIRLVTLFITGSSEQARKKRRIPSSRRINGSYHPSTSQSAIDNWTQTIDSTSAGDVNLLLDPKTTSSETNPRTMTLHPNFHWANQTSGHACQIAEENIVGRKSPAHHISWLVRGIFTRSVNADWKTVPIACMLPMFQYILFSTGQCRRDQNWG